MKLHEIAPHLMAGTAGTQLAAPRRSVVTVGNFDGVHRGHQQLLDQVVSRARHLNADSVVITFDPHPLFVIRPDAAPKLLTSTERRVTLLRGHGIDRVLVLPFTAQLARWEPSEFIERILGAEGLGTAEVYVGENFRFGHRAAGDVAMMSRIGAGHGMSVHGVPLAGGSVRWCSTAVRCLLAEGSVEAAADMLGRPHRITGVITHHNQDRSSSLDLDARSAIPASGCYHGRLVHISHPPEAIRLRVDETANRAALQVVERGGVGQRISSRIGETVDVDIIGRQRPLQ